MTSRNARNCTDHERGLTRRNSSSRARTVVCFQYKLLCSLALMAVVAAGNPCKKFYRTELPHHCTTRACASCPAGSGVVKFCNGSSPTVCKACVAGINFSNRSNPYDVCESVSQCRSNQVVSAPATRFSDVQCVCRHGYEVSTLGNCVFKVLFVTNSYTTTANQWPSSSGSSQLTSTKVLPLETENVHTPSSSSIQLPMNRQSETKMVSSSMVSSTGFIKTTGMSATIIMKSADDTLMSTIVLALSLVIVVVITAVVVMVACRYYRCDKYCRRWSRGKREDDEEHLIGQPNSHHRRNVQNASVGLQYTLRADIPFSYLPWKTYNWTKNDIPLKQSSRVTINNTSVTFIDVQPDAAGEYCCRNKSGEPQKTIQFVVKENLLPNYRVDEGMPLVLKYVIHAADMCSDWSYQWFCDGVQLRSASRDWSGENVTKLAIYRVSGRKKYWCVAKSDEWRLKLQSATAVVTCSGIRSSTTDFTPTDCTPTKDALPNRDGNDIGGTTDLETKLEDDMGQETGAASARGRDIIQATEDHPQHFLEQVVHSSEKNDATTGHVVQGKLFSCVKHLTAEILHQLAKDIGGPNNDLSSVLAIAESMGVDVEEVKHRATMSSKDLSLFALERLREINPDYPLSALCHIFVENDRPECAVELTKHVRRADGILRLPDRLQKQLSSLIGGME
ncbi:uncharacterized protein LOC134189799 isoform X2 [Corticium candelabrum]|uniref:uncharacterized protein LOC134189799 isoform X2 n=1 Tax=Corticium candelabrum TaxID=121492 RepID=UPI002E254422|nr:uncharacterized protein LOC134189799 isoform X2 [Corticium candelabrum]